MTYYAETAECPTCERKLVPGGAYSSHVRTCNGQRKTRLRSRYREVFFAHNGPGPYSCAFCSEDVFFEAIYVHHVDHDPTNDDPANLAASHKGCHNSHHFFDMWESRKTRKVGFAAPTAGHRQPHSEETKAKLSAAAKAAHARRRAQMEIQ